MKETDHRATSVSTVKLNFFSFFFRLYHVKYMSEKKKRIIFIASYFFVWLMLNVSFSILQ